MWILEHCCPLDLTLTNKLYRSNLLKTHRRLLGEYSLLRPIQGRTAVPRGGIVYDLSVVYRLYNFRVRLSKQGT